MQPRQCHHMWRTFKLLIITILLLCEDIDSLNFVILQLINHFGSVNIKFVSRTYHHLLDHLPYKLFHLMALRH